MDDAASPASSDWSRDKAFIAGADISELAQITRSKLRSRARSGKVSCDLIEIGKPVIAAVNGFASAALRNSDGLHDSHRC